MILAYVDESYTDDFYFIADEAFDVIGKHAVRFIVCGLDVRRLRARYRHPEPPHAIVAGCRPWTWRSTCTAGG